MGETRGGDGGNAGPQMLFSGGAGSRGEEEREGGGVPGGDVWASPGATGTHTSPTAFP